MEPISRRTLLAMGAVAVVGGPGLRRSGRASAGAGVVDNPFVLGVTSGDPDRRSVVLWTRLTNPDGSPLDTGDLDVTWEVAADDGFASTLASGTVVAAATEGHSVHVVAAVSGPCSNRFRVGDWTSPVGRTSATASSSEPPASLRIAAATCQHFETGFYAAHRDIAEWAPDVVVFLGDFIYEGASRPGGDDRVRSHNGDEPRDLDGYRTRYAQYLSDPDLQASRSACPWLVIWDDHEVENNYAGLTSEDADPEDVFAARRISAYQAWWEHMPVRLPRPAPDIDNTIYRTISWGSLADLILLDGRQYRSDQACGDVVLSTDPACPEAVDPARTMLGAEQELWLNDQLVAAQGTWPVIVQQTVLTDARLPNGAVLNYDQWDGYAPARDRLMLSAAANTDRTIVLTGDIHLAGVGILPAVGIEFITTSVSSSGLVPVDFEDALAQFPDIAAAELAHRGYIRHTVDPQQWVAEYRTVDDVTDPASPVSTWKSFTVDATVRDAVAETRRTLGT